MENKGVTLLALVITIIILLILSSVILNMVLGERGIIEKSKDIVLLSREAQVEEENLLWRTEIAMAEYTAMKVRTADEIIQELYNRNLLIRDEYDKLMDKENNPERKIFIKSKDIYFNLEIEDGIEKPTDPNTGVEELEKPKEEVTEQFNRANAVIEIVWIDKDNNVIENPEKPILRRDESSKMGWGTRNLYSRRTSR